VKYFRHEKRAFKAVADDAGYPMKNPNYRPPSVRAEYYSGRKFIAQQWLCPQHEGFPKKKAGWYWACLGGRYPIPKTVMEFLGRALPELSQNVEITVSKLSKYPEIKNVRNREIVSTRRPERNSGEEGVEKPGDRQMEMFPVVPPVAGTNSAVVRERA
jgi:hypothetical protein